APPAPSDSGPVPRYRSAVEFVSLWHIASIRGKAALLSWCQCYLLSTLQLHHNGALQYVNKRMCVVSVDSARPAGRMLCCDHQNFLAGVLRKIFRHARVVIDPAVPDGEVLDKEIVRLRGLELEELQARWHTAFRRRAPSHLPRHLLFR